MRSNSINKIRNTNKIKVRFEPELWVGRGHYDKNGKFIKTHEEKAKCYTYNFLSMLAARMTYNYQGAYVRGAEYATTLYEGFIGDNSNTSMIQKGLCINQSQVGTIYHDPEDVGILVGTGNRPTKLQDYALESRVDDGVSAGQLSYGSHTFTNTITEHASYYGWVVTRTFTNTSGGDIDVSEIGLFSVVYYPMTRNLGSYDDNSLLIARDVPVSSFTIANNSSEVIFYEIRVAKSDGEWIFVKNFLEQLKLAMTAGNDSGNLRIGNMSGNVDGILVSASDSVVAGNISSMDNQISHGNTEGKLLHMNSWSLTPYLYSDENPDISTIDSLADADDCSLDNTADWTKNNCDLLFDTDHYTIDSNATGDMYIEKTITGLEVGRSYAPVVTFQKDVDGNHRSVNVVVRNSSDTGDMVTGTAVTSSASNKEAMAIFTATATSHKIRINVASAVMGEVFSISDIDVRLSEAWVKIYRHFYNQSGASIDVKKVYFVQADGNIVVGAKKLAATQAVADGEVLEVETEIGVKVT